APRGLHRPRLPGDRRADGAERAALPRGRAAAAGVPRRMRRSLDTLADYEAAARRRLPRLAYDFIAGGADSEVTLGENVAAFDRRRTSSAPPAGFGASTRRSPSSTSRRR